jgi:hypothetical protein
MSAVLLLLLLLLLLFCAVAGAAEVKHAAWCGGHLHGQFARSRNLQVNMSAVLLLLLLLLLLLPFL